MHVVIATPLYPPDIAEPAPYVKELAKRLSAHHSVTVVVYGHLPEKVPGVSYVCIDKRAPIPIRLVRFLVALWRATRDVDALYILNGASVELPALIVNTFRHTPFLLHAGDADANEWVAYRPLLRIIKRLAVQHAHGVIHDFPMKRPEILPFQPKPESALRTHEASWREHTNGLLSLLRTL